MAVCFRALGMAIMVVALRCYNHEIKRKIEDAEKLREIIKVIRVHSQDEIEIEWNFDDIFSEQR